jgi:hypothetical protein
MRHLTSTTLASKPHILAVIDANPKLASSTKARYKRVIAGYLDSGGSLSDAEALAAYSQGLSKSGRSFLKAAIKLWLDSATSNVPYLGNPNPAFL